MSKYIILKPDNNDNLILIKKGLTLDEAKGYINSKDDPSEYIIIEDFNGIAL